MIGNLFAFVFGTTILIGFFLDYSKKNKKLKEFKRMNPELKI